jgi:transcriptional regulator GlxA family with amidase domain
MPGTGRQPVGHLRDREVGRRIGGDVADQTLAAYGAVVSTDRVVIDGDVITCAGVSAGIDMGLTLAASLWGESTASAIQLALEYDPQPPFDNGSPERARPEIVAAVRAALSAA